ncbi:MAG: hypothetical protein U0805_01810 [Pirellulales bacterium]
MPRAYIAALLCLFIMGCGSNSPFKYTKASGKVTYEDGTPIPGVRLVFVAQDVAAVGTAHPRPAMANVDSQGNFDCVTSYKYGDGLIPGKHKVFIQASADTGGKTTVPKEYLSELTTPLVIDTANLPLEIKVPKPKK